MTLHNPMRDPVIVETVRTAVGRAKRGSLATTRPEELGATVVKELLNRIKPVNPADVEDLILGCAFPEGEQGLNMARLVALRAGLPDSVPAETVNRFCSSGLQSIAHAAFAIMSGQIEIAIAGGVESMSMVPMTGYKFAPLPSLALEAPQYFISMGLTAENVALRYQISREQQDRFSLLSHQRATAALEAGRFADQIVPVQVDINEAKNGKVLTRSYAFRRDEGPRQDTTLEALGKLKPAFKDGGTATAGNSSQMSDGAAAVMIMSQARLKISGSNH
jgi:acetyl-CoA acyltransferase